MEVIETKTETGMFDYKKKMSEGRKKRDERVKEEIETLGIKTLIDSIVSQGYPNVSRVLKSFLKNDKNVEATIEFLKGKDERKQKNSERRTEKKKSLEEMVENLHLNSEIEFIRSKFPHLSLKKMLIALSRNGNNAEKAVDCLAKNSSLARKEAKYKELFPDDTEYDWDKFRANKKELRVKSKSARGERRALYEAEKQKRDEHLKQEIPEGINTLYLDGNNMLFVDSTIRGLCMKKKMKEACEKLAELFYVYASSRKLNTILIFDQGKLVYELESDGAKFKVCNARPNYETSDDALVDWAGGLSASDLAGSLFVTSDRGLLTRLIEKGAFNLMKSGVWLKILKRDLGEEIVQEVLNK